MNLTLIILGIGFVLALLFVLGAMLIGTVLSPSRAQRDNSPGEPARDAGVQPDITPGRADGAAAATTQSPGEPGRSLPRTLDLLAKLPPDSRAVKCRHCGATVDSTAELSSKGEIRCNYCNAWTSIYEK